MTVVTNRSLDAGAPFPLWAPTRDSKDRACDHGVWVETPLDAAAEELAREVTLRLRHAARSSTTSLEARGDSVTVALSLDNGRCSPRDEAARRFLADLPWLADELARNLDWMAERASRAIAQRDRSSCAAALARRTDDLMISYEELFPADWDLLVLHGGKAYWVADQHCPKVACPCNVLVLQLYRLYDSSTYPAGKLTLDLRSSPQRPEATTPLAAELFEPVWQRHGKELLRRREEVRAAVQRAPTGMPTTSSAPSRNGPCPCGSGKKYKRCCATAAAGSARRR
jgi:hypothetical protein